MGDNNNLEQLAAGGIDVGDSDDHHHNNEFFNLYNEDPVDTDNSNSRDFDLGLQYNANNHNIKEDPDNGYEHGQLNHSNLNYQFQVQDDISEKEPDISCLFCLNHISFPENSYSHHNPDLDPDTAAVLCQILGLNRQNDEFLDFFQNASYCEDCQNGLDQLKTHFDIVLSYRRLFLELLCSNYGDINNRNLNKPPPPKLRRIDKFDFVQPAQPKVKPNPSASMPLISKMYEEDQDQNQIEEIHGGDEDENGFLYFPQIVHNDGGTVDQDEVSISSTSNSYNAYGTEDYIDEFDPDQNDEDPDNFFLDPNDYSQPEVDMIWGDEEDSSNVSYSSDFSFMNNLPSTSSSATPAQKRKSNLNNNVGNPPRKRSKKVKVVVHSEVKPGVQVTTTSIQAIPDTDPQSFSCPTCFKILKNRNTYNSHKKYCQSNLDQCTCSMCGLTCQGQTHLAIHMEGVHLGLRPFKCGQCDLSFKTENALRAHHLVHNNERPFICQTCGLQFRRDADLRKHIQNVHQCLRPYECTICSQRFKRTSHLKEHMGRKHKLPMN